MTAGFVAPQNLALCHIVDLPGGSEANSDESRAGEWGPATIAALKAFNFDVSEPVSGSSARTHNRPRLVTD